MTDQPVPEPIRGDDLTAVEPPEQPDEPDGDLAKQVLIEPDSYTGQPVENGPQDDLDDDADYEEALSAAESPAEGSAVPEAQPDPASPPAGS
jgi:hypothetical protein